MCFFPDLGLTLCLLSWDLMEQCISVYWFDLKWWDLLILLDFFGFLLWVLQLSPVLFISPTRSKPQGLNSIDNLICSSKQHSLKLSNSIQKSRVGFVSDPFRQSDQPG